MFFLPVRVGIGMVMAILHALRLLLQILYAVLAMTLLVWLGIGIWLAWYAGDPSHLIAVVIIFMVLGAVTKGSSLYWMAYLPIYCRRDGMRACLDE